MKKLFLLLLLSLGLANVSNAEVKVPGWIEADTMEKICKNISCNRALKEGILNAYRKDYYGKTHHKAFAISTTGVGQSITAIEGYGSTFGHMSSSVTTRDYAKFFAEVDCKKKYRNCRILFVNNQVHDKALYKLLMSSKNKATDISTKNTYTDSYSGQTFTIPANSKYSKSFSPPFVCNENYYKSGLACQRVPANGYSGENSNHFFCDAFYKQSGSKCIKDRKKNYDGDPLNSSRDVSVYEDKDGWTCIKNYYRNDAKTACLKVPANSTSSDSSNFFKCNTGYTKTGNSCKKDIVIPANAHASGSTWACNTGYTKTGKTCTNTAELEKKKLEQEKLAKERKAAQIAAKIYFNDLLEFLKINNSEYDIAEIVGLVSKNKAMLTEPWNDVIEKNFDELKDFTSTSRAFLDYHESKNDERQKVILNEFARENTRLKNIHAYLNFYVQNNITSDIAQAVLDQIKLTEGAFQLQSLNELTKVSNQLERFIAKNNLSSEYRSFVKSLSQSKPEKSDVSASTIDDTDLVNFDFIKNADKLDYIALVNLSGKAPNALLNLEGNVVFENDRALSCFYQSKATVKNDLKYYLYDKVSNKEFLAQDRGFECNQNNLLSYDLVFFEKDTLLRESKSYVSSLAAAIAYNQLQLFKIVTNEEQQEDFAYRKIKVANITQSLMDETILGFGSLIIDNDNTTLCTDVENTLGHSSIMNLLSNEFTRMGYGKSVDNVTFNNVEVTFANVQRGRCGFIYAGEESLANLLNAFKVSGTKYDILPIWYSNKQINQEQQRHESKQQQKLIDVQKTKEELEKQKLLEQERLKADGILKAEQQAELRNRNRNIVKAHVQLVRKEASLLLDKDPSNTGEMLSLYPELISFVEKKLKESWELDMFSVEINDYGLGNYRDRVIETFVTDINFKLKNRILGEYEAFCVRVAILVDKEFDFFREPKLAVCESNSLDSYKKKLDFQSSWIVR